MKDIILDSPQKDLDFPLMQAINRRRTYRKITHESLDFMEISNLLWVACGETRKASKSSKNRRTIPSACNSQKVHVCVALPSGVYRYDEVNHVLVQLNEIDVRDILAKQPMLKNAPIGLIYVARKERKSGVIKHNDEMQALLVGTEIGAMSQNVYLYCASTGLNSVLVALYDREKLSSLINLEADEEIIMTHIIG